MVRPRATLSAVGMVLLVLAACAGEPSKGSNGRATGEKQPQEAAAGAPAEKRDGFIRLARDAQKMPVALESAVVTFVPEDCGKTSPTVDLVAAVHVAEKGYYEQLNKLFSKYDVVLYEMVAPEGVKIPKNARPDNKHPVTAIQTFMTRVLELEYQLKGIDYTKRNMVHADMSPEQLAAAMEKRGESVWTILVRAIGYSLAREGGTSGMTDARVFLALFDKNRSLALKRVLAEEFQDLEGSLQAIEGPDGSALLADRNKVALKVLRKQIGAGKRKIAIFYGAAHMPDFQKHLRDDFGLVPLETRWLVAWDLKGDRKAAPAQSPRSPRKPAEPAAK